MDVIKELTASKFVSTQVSLDGNQNVQINTFYHAFYGALYRQEKLLRSLITEIENFEFVPADIDNDPEIPDLIKPYRKEIDTRINKLRSLYGNTLLDIRISIVLFCVALLEGIMSEYLLNKCVSKSEFERYDSLPFMHKWKNVPVQFNQSYNLPSDLDTSLTQLYTERRKIMIHDKPTLVEDGVVSISGRGIPKTDNETELLLDWCSLPEKLIANLLSSDPETSVMGSKMQAFKVHCDPFLSLRN